MVPLTSLVKLQTLQTLPTGFCQNVTITPRVWFMGGINAPQVQSVSLSFLLITEQKMLPRGPNRPFLCVTIYSDGSEHL